jgi:hypothetical protein
LDHFVSKDQRAYDERIRVLLEGMITENERDTILRYFRFEHLPTALRPISAAFARLAIQVCADAKPSAERTVALRKLLEGKDAAVRACLP